MQTAYVPPTLTANAFNCSRCRVFAKQNWFYLTGATERTGYGGQYENKEFVLSKCESCGEPTIWHGKTIIYPVQAVAEPPNPDLPEDIREDFEEARVIANFSPRGAAALLRLSIQKLCAHLGQSGKNINSDIGALVKAGLPLLKAISRLEREIELLREYRTRLVADVVTGKLDVREVASRLPKEAAADTAEDNTDLSIDPEAADEEAAV